MSVVLDVSVRDRDRHPVRGLTAGDFTILDDGKPQVVQNCSVPHDVCRNEDFQDRRLIVILLDDAVPVVEAAVRLRIAGRTADNTVFEQASTIAPGAFNGKSVAGVIVPLPVEQLSPVEYLPHLEAPAAGHNAQRAIRRPLK